MSICVYDNPATMARECWQDGKLVCHYSAAVLLGRKRPPAEAFFFGANIGPWSSGRIVGDPLAAKENSR